MKMTLTQRAECIRIPDKGIGIAASAYAAAAPAMTPTTPFGARANGLVPSHWRPDLD